MSIQALCEELNAAPYYQLLGMRAESEESGRVRITLPFDKKLRARGKIKALTSVI